MFQIAMRQIDDYCQQNNLTVAGYYESPEVVKSAIPSPFAEKVGEKIREHFKEAFLFHIIWLQDGQFAVRPFVKEVRTFSLFILTPAQARKTSHFARPMERAGLTALRMS